jgi:hypothetical protein
VTLNDVTPRHLQCRMQVQGKESIYATRYSSPLDCAVKTLQSEGVSLIAFRELFDIDSWSKEMLLCYRLGVYFVVV